jgi:hypothetical protein
MHPISLVGFSGRPEVETGGRLRMNTAMKVWTYLAIAAGMAAIVLTFGAARDAQRRCDSMRLAAVDRKLQLIMDHLGIAEPDQYLPKVIAHLAQGRKVKPSTHIGTPPVPTWPAPRKPRTYRTRP